MVSQKRSLSDALELTPEVKSFIRGQEEPVKLSEPKAKKKEPTPKTNLEANVDAKKIERPEQDENKVLENNTTSAFEARVAVTTRFRHATAELLRRVSLERKLMGKRPWSQQEIIEEAVNDWIRKEKALKLP